MAALPQPMIYITTRLLLYYCGVLDGGHVRLQSRVRPAGHTKEAGKESTRVSEVIRSSEQR